jgi:hypothetical protein
MTTSRKVDESPVYQGEDESIAYTFQWSAVGTPTSPTVVIKDNTLTDKSSTCLSGSASVVGTTVVTPLVTALTSGIRYRLECKVTISGNIYEAYCDIIAEE